MPYKLECIGFENKNKEDRHTVIRNHNEELRRRLTTAADPNIIKIGWPQKEWKFEGFDEDNEARLTQGKNVLYITAEEYQNALSEAKKAARKQLVDAGVEFFTQHGPLHSHREDKNYYHWSNQTLLGGTAGTSGDMGTFWSTNRSFIHRVGVDYLGQRTEEIKLRHAQHGNVGFMRFNENGDFVCRDYNFDIEQHYNRQDQPDYRAVYDRFIKAIHDLGPALIGGGKLFYDKHATAIELEQKPDWNEYVLELNLLPVSSSGSYKPWRGPSFKKPKKLIEASAEEVVSFIEKAYLTNLKPLFLKRDELRFVSSVKEL